MRTREVAERAGVNVETLRYYERRGLLDPPERSPAGHRAYPPETVQVVGFIKRAQRVGFTLCDIAELLHLAAGGPPSCDAARTMAQDRLADLDRRIAELSSMRDALAELVRTCRQPPERRDCPLLDTLDAPGARR